VAVIELSRREKKAGSTDLTAGRRSAKEDHDRARDTPSKSGCRRVGALRQAAASWVNLAEPTWRKERVPGGAMVDRFFASFFLLEASSMSTRNVSIPDNATLVNGPAAQLTDAEAELRLRRFITKFATLHNVPAQLLAPITQVHAVLKEDLEKEQSL
jgi:hypothetical protein